MSGANSPPRVSVVIPSRNEAKTIESLISSVLSHTANDCEVIVADGNSNDGTRQILDRLARQNARLRILDNPKRSIPAGLNTAISAARGRFIVRMDGHTRYAPDYVEACVNALVETGADNVGGPALADIEQAVGYIARTIACSHQSALAVGGASLHDPTYEGPTDAVAYGCWRREIFDRVGFFDEDLDRNEDGEHCRRIQVAGGTVWQTPRIRSWYRPRATLNELRRQYSQYGYWKSFEVRKLRAVRAWRQLAPAGFLLFVLLSAILALWFPLAATTAFAALLAYAVFVVVATISVCIGERQWRIAPALPFAFGAMHLGYATGFLCGAWDFWIARRTPRTGYSQLTR